MRGIILASLIRSAAEGAGRDVRDLEGALRVLPLEEGIRDVPVPSGSAHHMLTAAYEYLQRLEAVESGGRIVLRVSPRARRARGVFYTAAPLADAVARLALTPCPPSLPRVLDPAMGTGVFLLAAARALVFPLPLRTVAETCLWGIDLDPTALDLAVAGIWLETGASPTRLRERFVQADALLHPPRERFDAVLGNPPWGTTYRGSDRVRLQAAYPACAATTMEPAKLFLDLGTRLTRGTLAMIVPQALLRQDTHADIRTLLLSRLAPRAALTFPASAFPGAAAPACALIFGPHPGPGDVSVQTPDGAVDMVPARYWSATAFRLRVDPPPSGRGVTLGSLSTSYRVRDCGLNYNRAAFAARCISPGPSGDPGDLPLCRGRDFDRYTPVLPSRTLRHDYALTLQPGETVSVNLGVAGLGEKIVLRQTADRLVGTLDRSCCVLGRSVIAVTNQGNASLPALLAWLNSSLLTRLYRALADEEGRVFPQVKVARLLALPVPDLHTYAVSAALSARAEEALAGSLQPDAEPDLLWGCLHVLACRRLSGGRGDEDACMDRIVEMLYSPSTRHSPLTTRS